MVVELILLAEFSVGDVLLAVNPLHHQLEINRVRVVCVRNILVLGVGDSRVDRPVCVRQ